MSNKAPFALVTEAAIPVGIIWDCTGSNKGQTIEVAYGRTAAQRTEADASSKWKRVTDKSEPVSSPDRVTYYSR